MSTSTVAGSTPVRAKGAIIGSGLSQRRVAEAIGIDETKLSKALAGRRRFTADELIRLATTTGVTVRWLLGDESQVSAVPASLGAGSRNPAESRGPAEVSGLAAAEGLADATPRRQIVEIAWSLFARLGYDSVRIADIAEAAGVSSASIHYHFTNKTELFAATLDYSVKLAFDRQIAWLDGIDDPAHRLERLLELQSPIGQTAHREWSIWLQTWARLALEGTESSDYPASYERWSRTVRTTIEDGQTEGLFRPGDSAAMADELTSLLDGLGVKVLTGVMDATTFRTRLQDYLNRAVLRTRNEEESP